jgi:hypothetical protein
VLIDKAQAFALARRQQGDRVNSDVRTSTHDLTNKRRLAAFVYFNAQVPQIASMSCEAPRRRCNPGGLRRAGPPAQGVHRPRFAGR